MEVGYTLFGIEEFMKESNYRGVWVIFGDFRVFATLWSVVQKKVDYDSDCKSRVIH